MPTPLTSVAISGLQLKETGAPATPASGYGRLYFSTGGTLHTLNDAGVDVDISGVYTGAITLAGQTIYDMMYASSGTQWTRLANGTTGQVLIATTGSAPSWGTPTLITVADTTDTTAYVALFEDATGSLAPKTDGGLTYNASTGVLTATGFSGPLTGNVTGNVSGTSGSTTGNAATATKLGTARTIGGVSFDGSANITIASATGGFTVSGGDLALGANNLTLTGSIASTGSRVLKGWFTDLEVTNAIAGSVTGNAGTVTNGVYTSGDQTIGGTKTFSSQISGSISGNAGGYAAALAVGSQAAGDIYYATSATATGRIGKGTAYQVLHMNAGATVPEWTSTLGVTGTRLTKGWFTDLEVTNAIAGSVTGASTSCSGNAATATALQTSRTIGGTSFDGTANITVASATGGFAVTGGDLVVGAASSQDRLIISPVAKGGGQFDGTLTLADQTAAHTWTLPNYTGTVITTGNLSDITSVGTLAGNVLFTDATYDIGQSGATRPRHGYFSGNITAGGTVTGTTNVSDGTGTMASIRSGAIGIASQTALDFIYAGSSSQLARLAAGSALQVPRINAAGTGWEFATVGGGATSEQAVHQVGHGLNVGDVIRVSGANTYTKAQADSAANSEVVGIVTSSPGADDFTYAMSGVITAGVPAQAAGTVMYLSASSAGALTATAPSAYGSVNKPLLVIIENGAKALLCNWRGQLFDAISGVYVHVQAAAATTWTVSHSLGIRGAAVTCVNASYQVIQPDTVTYTDGSTVTITFSVAVAGYAFLMAGGGALGDATLLTTGTVAVARGGTGLSSYTAGDLPYASGTTTISKLAIGTANKVLTSSGSAPQWVDSLALAGTLTVASDIGLAATKKLYLDGVAMTGDTYLVESAGNTLSLYAGNVEQLKLTATDTTVGGILTVSGVTASTAGRVNVGPTAGNGVGLMVKDGVYGVYTSLASALNFNYDHNAASTGYLNYVGYQGGTTQFRSLVVANGKNSSIALFNGADLATTLYGTLTVTSSGTDANRYTCYWNSSSKELIFVSSDERLKTAWADFDGLAIVRQLEPKAFTWKDHGEKQYGFSAQHTVSVDGRLAWHDAANDQWGLRGYDSFAAVSVRALQQHDAELSALRARVAELEGKEVNRG